MRGSLHHLLAGLIRDSIKIQRMMQLPSVGKPKMVRTSNKSKLKMTNAKPNVKYKSSKPIASKGITGTHRNKSNLR